MLPPRGAGPGSSIRSQPGHQVRRPLGFQRDLEFRHRHSARTSGGAEEQSLLHTCRSGGVGARRLRSAIRSLCPRRCRSTGTGTYNTFYREFGTRTVKTLRTSIVTDPPDGRIPALTPAAADVKRRRMDGIRNPENAEDLGLQDQCLAFLTAGPPMLPYSYNSNYQILQTRDAFVVHVEMIHDARIIPARTAARIFQPPSDDGWATRWAIGPGDTLRRRHDELQRRRWILRRMRAATSAGIGIFISSSDSVCSTPIRCLPIRDRRPDCLHEAVEGRADPDALDRTNLRIRLPRRQLLVDQPARGDIGASERPAANPAGR
mgnify:CR=1 FL=1